MAGAIRVAAIVIDSRTRLLARDVVIAILYWETVIASAGAFKKLSEQLLIERALERAANPVALLDRGTRVVWANNAYADRIEPVKPAASVSRVCQRLQATMGSGYGDLLRRLQAGDRWAGAITLDPDAEVPAIFDCILSPLPDVNGGPAYYLILLHDVTSLHLEKIKHAHAAKHDTLTGLGNRLRLAEAVSELIEREEPFSFFYMDLDGFKGVNDTLGHGVGDDVLKAFAQHLREVCRETDLPLRLGGDEFVIILPGPGSDAALQLVADRLISRAPAAFAAVDPRLHGRVGVSIGSARYPADGQTQQVLMEVADSALYQAKKAGKGRLVLGGANAA